jgi:hypothetical protein
MKIRILQYVGADNTDTFHVPIAERDIELDSVETDILDDTVVDSEVTYQVIEKGTERGKRKLVTSDGYSLVIYRKFNSSIVHCIFIYIDFNTHNFSTSKSKAVITSTCEERDTHRFTASRTSCTSL